VHHSPATVIVSISTDPAIRSTVTQVDRAAARWPGNRDVLMALATMQRDAGQRDAARRTVKRLAEAHPGDREIAALAEQLR